MLKNKTVAVVVPAYNEEKQIGDVIESMPEFVDRIIVVNDNSKDKTKDIVWKYVVKSEGKYHNSRIGERKIIPNRYNEAEIISQKNSISELSNYIHSEITNKFMENDKIILINNLKNGGVGASISRGYKWAKDNNVDCTAVMAGDGQMDPGELEDICLPIVEEDVDYVKGNRLIHRSSKYVIPRKRFLGNSVLSIMTKIASGYWRVSDTQTGYTAISLSALKAIKIYKIYPKYGMPNDLLVKLNIAGCTLREVEIKPVYRIGEQSKMRIRKVIPRILLLLVKGFCKRLWIKYFIRDFHPLFLLYIIGFSMLFLAIPFVIKLIRHIIFGIDANPLTLIAFVFLFISGFQSLMFAMWMDIQNNERLYK